MTWSCRRRWAPAGPPPRRAAPGSSRRRPRATCRSSARSSRRPARRSRDRPRCRRWTGAGRWRSPAPSLALEDAAARLGADRGAHVLLELEVAQLGIALEAEAGEDVAAPLHPDLLRHGRDDLLLAVEEVQLLDGHPRPFLGLQHYVPAGRHVVGLELELAFTGGELGGAIALLVEEVHA